MPDENMSAAQRQALEKSWDTLCEHFDRVLLVVDWETEINGERIDAHEGYWHGGILAAIGAAEFAKVRILEAKRQTNEPE